MRAAWIFAYNLVDGAVPNGLSLYMLGAGLLAAGLALALTAFGFSDYPAAARLTLAGFGNSALAAVAVANALRRSSALATRQPAVAFRFIHIAVAAHAALVLALLMPALRTLLDYDGALIRYSLPLIWTPAAGGALILALLNGLRWDARFACVGASASVAVFGCAVWNAPAIYGWDLRPLGWYAILASAIPVLAFLALFLRRASAFSESRWRRRGLAAALYIALACALGFQMASNPSGEFSGRLLAAMDERANPIMFSELTDFEWDEVEIYSAYVYPKQISPAAREGADIISLSHFGINDRLKFAAFLRDGEVVYYEAFWIDGYSIRLSSGVVDLAVLKSEDAVFDAEYADGYPVLTLKD